MFFILKFKKIFYFLIIFLLFILSFSNLCTFANEDTEQIINNAYKVRGFIGINTDLLEYYCATTQYIPYKYINAYESRFKNTIAEMNKIINKYDSVYIQQQVTKKLQKEIVDVTYENQIKNIQKNNPNFTKKDFCKMYDIVLEEQIQENVKVFVQNFPESFRD